MDEKKIGLLSEKIQLESNWNSQYLSNGFVTLEMVQIGRKVRDIRDTLRNLDKDKEVLSEYDTWHDNYSAIKQREEIIITFSDNNHFKNN